MQSDLIETVAQAHPLQTRALFRQVPHGATVADIVAGFDLPQRFGLPQVHLARAGRITVVPLDMWGKIRPKPGARVEISYVVEGPVAAALGAALVSAAAPYIAATTFGLTVGSLAYTVAVAAITVVGGLVLNALIPPVKQPKQDLEQYTITGIQNMENRYGIYPKVLGRCRIYPPKTARGYSETVGRDIYYRGRMTFGWGPVALEDLRIGTTPIHEFEDVEVEFLNVDQATTLAHYPQLAGITKAWRSGDDTLTLCPDDVAEDGYNVQLTSGNAVVRTTRSRTESASIDVAFPRGLIYHTTKGKRRHLSVTFQFRWRPLGGAWVSAGSHTYEATTTAYIRFTKTIAFPDPGEYEVEVMRVTHDREGSRDTDDSYLSGIRSFRSGNLPSHDGIAEIAFRLRASEQLSGNVDSLNAVVQQMAPIWTGSGWTAPQPVRHPAWVYLAAIRGQHLRRPVSDSRIDLDAFKSWADEEPHWTCDYVIDAETRTAEVLDIIAASGRARRALTDLRYSIIRDGAAGPVRQMFSPRNSWGFKGTIAFPRPIHALRCLVRSERLDWEQDEVTVYADGHDETTATEFETLEIPGVVVTAAEEDEGNVWRLGRYHLAQAILRPETYEWHADWEHMRVTRGDKAQLVHDVPVIGVGAARIRDIVPPRNLLTWTEDFANDAWRKPSTTIAAGPKLVEDTGTGSHLLRYQFDSGPGPGPATFAIDIKAAERSVVTLLSLSNPTSPSGGYRSAHFDLDRGIFVDAGAQLDGAASMVPLGGGWYRCILTAIHTTGGPNSYVDLRMTDNAGDFTGIGNNGKSYPGDGVSGVLIRRPQVEYGSEATAYQRVDVAPIPQIVLDEMFDMAPDRFRLTARAEDGSRHSLIAASPSDPATRTWTPEGAHDADGILPGDLVFVEEIAQESMEVLVTGVYPDGDNARITAVPAAPAVLLADQGEIPSYKPIITPGRQSALRGPDPPKVLRIISDESTMQVLPDGSVQARIGVTLEPVSTTVELGSVQLRWRLANGDDPWIYGAAQPMGAASYLTEAVARGEIHEVAVRTIGGTGRSQGWVRIGTVLAQGTEAPPPDVTGFSVAPIEQQVQLRWDDVEDITDIAWAEIRYAAVEGAAWNASVLLDRVAYPTVTARLFARAGTYLVKWVDWDGRHSVNAASVYISRNKLRELNAVEVLDCAPDWAGSFTRTEVTAQGGLLLEKSGDVYPATGTWTMTGSVDLGAVYPVQITPYIEAAGFSALDFMSAWESLAALPSLAASNPDAWRVDTEVRTYTPDDGWSGWQSVSGGDFVGQRFQFRVHLRSDREDVTPRVDMLSFVLDMPDRVDGIEDVSAPTAGLRIDYDPAFRNVPSVVVTPRDAPSGARVEITGKSRTGFNIRFFNSAGTAIAQRFDWVARGYGREVDD